MSKKILILGNGYIGNKLQKELGCPISTRRIDGLQILEEEVNHYESEIVINCIGHTGQYNVDACEVAVSRTLAANVHIPLLLAELAYRCKVKIVHISSGCIYHTQDKPIVETAEPDYFDLFYSRTKIYAERILKDIPNVLIVRIRIPLDNQPHPKNILTKLLKFTQVIDTPNSITYIPDFVRAVKHLINIDASGIYNVVNKGCLKYPDLLKEYGKSNYQIVTIKDLNLNRTNLVLSVKKLEDTGFKVRNINDVLKECVKEHKMPKDFTDCVAKGGRVRTIKISDGRYMRICWLDGKSFHGEVKTKKKGK